MTKQVVVIGAGINGQVAANYLQRSGFSVTLLEKRDSVGGACAVDYATLQGRKFEYPCGATVLGFMQDFVFRDTGLSEQLTVCAPQHPAVVFFEGDEEPCLIHDDVESLKTELRRKWQEEGDIAQFLHDFEQVRNFIVSGYRNAEVPTLERAYAALGRQLTELWISGSARTLLDRYFTSEQMKVYTALDVMESGPVSIDSPYSAFTIPLMSSGTVFDGRWGFVKGGIWKINESLHSVNEKLGVNIITGAEVLHVSETTGQVHCLINGHDEYFQADHVLFATDPVSAARLVGDSDLTETVSQKAQLGTSAKLVMFFNQPAIWKAATGLPDFDLAFKFIISVDTLDELERTTQEVVTGECDFSPGYFEIYSEGAGRRKLGEHKDYDSLSVFFKNVAFSKSGKDLDNVRHAVEATVLSRIANPEDFIGSVLLTPKDLHDRFDFPQGNIDHLELSAGQTYFSRSFSPHPAETFYQFGRHANISYCAAGAYPCGSIAGTAGYMCATELIRTSKPTPVSTESH